jgi:hypothetical protein
MKKSLTELKGLVKNQITVCNRFLTNEATINQKNNPQVKSMIDECTARKEALEDILLYIETGSTYQLKIGQEV